MIVKPLTEHHLEFLSLKGGCRGSSESTHVKMPHCWKSHATAQIEVPTIHLIISPPFKLSMSICCIITVFTANFILYVTATFTMYFVHYDLESIKCYLLQNTCYIILTNIR